MKDLTKGNIYKNFLLFAVPMVLSGILSQAYQTIDTVIAGKMIGDSGLAAIGATAPLDTFFNSVFWGFGGGIGIYVANLFGAKRFFRLKSVIINNLLVMYSVIIAISILFVIFRNYVYDFLQIDPAIRSDADKYYTIITLGKATTLFTVTSIHIVNALGDSSFPFYMSLTSAILNVAGNIFTVAVLKMGIAGLALATVVSALAVDICYIFKFRKCFKALGVDRHRNFFTFRSVKETLSLSVATTVQQSIMYFSSMILSPIVNGIGGAASASYAVCIRVHDINTSIYQNAAKTAGNYIAQCYGAKKFKQINKGLLVGLMQNTLFVLPVLLCCVVFPKQICSLFFSGETSPQALNYSVIFLRFYLPFIVFNIVGNLMHHFFRGIARMKPLIIATLCGTVARIVFSIVLVPHLGIHGIYIGWIMFWIVDALFGIGLYFFNNWRQEIYA